ncbi:MAG: substrate-binding domain-containing protein, partial [Candidatus Hadarchaeum sp.]
VMAVNPDRNSRVNFRGALELIKFLVSDQGQNLIAQFGIDEYGVSLFNPAVSMLKNTSDPVSEWIRRYAFIDKSECPTEFRFGQEDLYQ